MYDTLRGQETGRDHSLSSNLTLYNSLYLLKRAYTSFYLL